MVWMSSRWSYPMLRNLLSFALAACLTALYCQAQGAIDSIDSTTAVQIAESAASKLYGEHEVDAEQPLSVMGNRGMGTWEVYGTPCCPDRNARHTCEADRCVGGIIHVSIRPTDGKVLLLERVILPRIAFTWLHGRTPQDVTYEWASDGGCGGTGGDPFVLGGLCAGGLIRHAKVAIYAPGCESMKFDLDLPSSEPRKQSNAAHYPTRRYEGLFLQIISRVCHSTEDLSCVNCRCLLTLKRGGGMTFSTEQGGTTRSPLHWE